MQQQQKQQHLQRQQQRRQQQQERLQQHLQRQQQRRQQQQKQQQRQQRQERRARQLSTFSEHKISFAKLFRVIRFFSPENNFCLNLAALVRLVRQITDKSFSFSSSTEKLDPRQVLFQFLEFHIFVFDFGKFVFSFLLQN